MCWSGPAAGASACSQDDAPRNGWVAYTHFRNNAFEFELEKGEELLCGAVRLKKNQAFLFNTSARGKGWGWRQRCWRWQR
jgi:hypothetical protein